MDRIGRIGPFVIYGEKRETPNEFTELGDAVDNFKKELAKVFKPVSDLLVKWIE